MIDLWLDWQEKTDFLLEHPETLNEWELEFVDSITKQLSILKELSFHQSCKLREVFNKVVNQ